MFPLYSLQSKHFSFPGWIYVVSFSNNFSCRHPRKHFTHCNRDLAVSYIVSTINRKEATTKNRYGEQEKVW
jgi:hypothetical protein